MMRHLVAAQHPSVLGVHGQVSGRRRQQGCIDTAQQHLQADPSRHQGLLDHQAVRGHNALPPGQQATDQVLPVSAHH